MLEFRDSVVLASAARAEHLEKRMQERTRIYFCDRMAEVILRRYLK